MEGKFSSMSLDSSPQNTRSVSRRKDLVHPLEKMLSLFARRVKGQPSVTLTLCLFSGLPPGSVSNCGRWLKICLCYSRGSRLLNRWVGKRLTGQFGVFDSRHRGGGEFASYICVCVCVSVCAGFNSTYVASASLSVSRCFLNLPFLCHLTGLSFFLSLFVFLFLPCCSKRSLVLVISLFVEELRTNILLPSQWGGVCLFAFHPSLRLLCIF